MGTPACPAMRRGGGGGARGGGAPARGGGGGGGGGRAGQDGHAGLPGDAAGGDLVAELFEHLGAGADEGEAGRLGGAGELGVFREEAVAGVDGLDLVLAGEGDDGGDVEVGADGLAA